MRDSTGPNRFTPPEIVKVRPGTESFRSGFRYGTVIRVEPSGLLRVAWNANDRVVRVFRPQDVIKLVEP